MSSLKILDRREIGERVLAPRAAVESEAHVKFGLDAVPVAVDVRARSLRLEVEAATEEASSVAGRGDIWTLTFEITNAGVHPLPAWVVPRLLCLVDADGCRYPCMTGASAGKLSYVLESAEFDRFDTGMLPLLPKVPTTGMLGFVLPQGGGAYSVEGV